VLGHVGSFPRGSSVDPAWSWSWEIIGFDPHGLYLVYWQYRGAFHTRSTMPHQPGVEPSLFNTFLLVLVFGGSSCRQCLAHEVPECLNLVVRIRIRTCISLIGRSHRTTAPHDHPITLAVPCLRVTMGLWSSAAR
jgi:hypothetical protein